MNSIKYFRLICFFMFMTEIFAQTEIDVKKIQCLVCKAVVEKIEKEIEKISPTRKVDVGRYRLDSQGNTVNDKVEYRRSEIFLTEMFDEICNSMEDWVKGTQKSNGQLVIFPIMVDGQMNPYFKDVDIIPDSNLNKNIKLYCEVVLEENEDTMLELFRTGSEDIDIKLCSNAAKLCNESLDLEEEYLFVEEKDEL